ncbi:MAG: hypothetical protein M3Y07_03775 [Acidobacteriota bacterium]|nr:hypothetical protein [Acidobacteriota bacterium]
MSPFLYARSLSLGNPAQAEVLLRKSIARNGQFAEAKAERDRQARLIDSRP